MSTVYHAFSGSNKTVDDVIDFLLENFTGDDKVKHLDLLVELVEEDSPSVHPDVFHEKSVANFHQDDVDKLVYFDYDNFNGSSVRVGYILSLEYDTILLHDLSVGGEYRRFNNSNISNRHILS
jgi:hypothetical protein